MWKLETIMFLRRASHKVQLLETLPLFGGLHRKYLDVIARHADQVRLDPGHAWARRGRIPREVLFIVGGRAQVERDGEVICCLGPGEFFGDLELVDGERRIEKVIAETPLAVMVVEARSLSYLLRAIPGLRTRLLLSLSGRLPEAELARTGPVRLPGRQPAAQPPEPIAASGSTSS
jgi:CRP-like cAMP-binding protein